MRTRALFYAVLPAAIRNYALEVLDAFPLLGDDLHFLIGICCHDVPGGIV